MLTFLFFINIFPSVGKIFPDIKLKRVVLPAPFEPIMVIKSPVSTLKECEKAYPVSFTVPALNTLFTSIISSILSTPLFYFGNYKRDNN